MNRARRDIALIAAGAGLLVYGNGLQAGPSYEDARWDPIHFKPAIERANNEECLVCHAEILERRVLDVSPAGVEATETLAWYQTLHTYVGPQETVHRRHLVTEYASAVMDMKCITCHQGNDPREEASGSSATAQGGLTLRKHVDPDICLMCHGQHNGPIMGVPPGDWRKIGEIFPQGCMTCHSTIRTNRHRVNYLKPDAIEVLAKENDDVCFGCHGGRAWYRIYYPYPRHPWPGAAGELPDWAEDRPTASQPRFLIGLPGGTSEPTQGDGGEGVAPP